MLRTKELCQKLIRFNIFLQYFTNKKEKKERQMQVKDKNTKYIPSKAAAPMNI